VGAGASDADLQGVLGAVLQAITGRPQQAEEVGRLFQERFKLAGGGRLLLDCPSENPSPGGDARMTDQKGYASPSSPQAALVPSEAQEEANQEVQDGQEKSAEETENGMPAAKHGKGKCSLQPQEDNTSEQQDEGSSSQQQGCAAVKDTDEGNEENEIQDPTPGVDMPCGASKSATVRLPRLPGRNEPLQQSPSDTAA